MDMHTPRWTRVSEFPASWSEWSSCYPLLFMRIDGEARVRRHLRTANPTFPILLSAPSTAGRYLPPVLVDSKKPTRRLIRDSRRMSYTCGAFALFSGIWFCLDTDFVGALGFFFVCLTMSFYFGFNYHLYRTDVGSLARRWQFHGWCFSKGSIHAYAFLVFMMMIGVAQWYGMRVFGSEDAVKEAFGLVYEALSESAEWWRFMTAPLMHNGIAHWAVNALAGSGLLLIYGPVIRARVTTIILLAAPISFVAVYSVYFAFPLDSDGIVGISGGIAGVVGYFLAANIRCRKSFPEHYYVTTLYIAASTLLVISMVISITSFVAHFAGFATGIALGYLTQPISPSFYLDENADLASSSRQNDTVTG